MCHPCGCCRPWPSFERLRLLPFNLRYSVGGPPSTDRLAVVDHAPKRYSSGCCCSVSRAANTISKPDIAADAIAKLTVRPVLRCKHATSENLGRLRQQHRASVACHVRFGNPPRLRSTGNNCGLCGKFCRIGRKLLHQFAGFVDYPKATTGSGCIVDDSQTRTSVRCVMSVTRHPSAMGIQPKSVAQSVANKWITVNSPLPIGDATGRQHVPASLAEARTIVALALDADQAKTPLLRHKHDS